MQNSSTGLVACIALLMILGSSLVGGVWGRGIPPMQASAVSATESSLTPETLFRWDAAKSLNSWENEYVPLFPEDSRKIRVYISGIAYEWTIYVAH